MENVTCKKRQRSENWLEEDKHLLMDLTADHAESIANTEIECRKEVHQAQMANEERKARNLDLDETLIKLKIEYYKKNF